MIPGEALPSQETFDLTDILVPYKDMAGKTAVTRKAMCDVTVVKLRHVLVLLNL